jgi:hypothetical protein
MASRCLASRSIIGLLLLGSWTRRKLGYVYIHTNGQAYADGTGYWQ